MKLFAISDLHLNYQANREAFQKIPDHADDGLILAGDIAETEEHLHFAFKIAKERFAHTIWVPGNHELWVRPNSGFQGSVEKYEFLVSLCHTYGILTPEDPYFIWEGHGTKYTLAPIFLLYDYSFRPEIIPEADAVAWARASGILCRDETFLNPHPYASKQKWCQARLEYTQMRLAEVSQEAPLVLINHFPLRQDLIRLKKIPRFSIWCGTKKTESWHIQYPVAVVVTGHLHMRATDYRDGVRFEEVSLGYPKQWNPKKVIQDYLREILPGPLASHEDAGPFWHWGEGRG